MNTKKTSHKYQPDIHHRRSIRLQEYDYSQANSYFITICSQNKQCFFGEIQHDKMTLNPAGLMTVFWYRELENKFTNIKCDEFICMPNHLHFIINIIDEPIEMNITISTIVQWYKTMTTNSYIRGIKQNGWQAFNRKLWQRNYWERVIRNENELGGIRDYIKTNPMSWEQDKLHTMIN